MHPGPTAAPDSIRTVSAPTTASILISGSKFLALLAPVSSAEETEAALTQRKRRYPDASHHCWACRTGRPDTLIEKSADAGEPSGTAGRPILDTLRGASLENVVCIVTRYFGGTKLGTGGLVRAYAEATQTAIARAEVVERSIVRVIGIDFDHERTGIVYRALDEFGVHFQQGTYDERAHGTIEVAVSKVDALRLRISELAHSGVEWHPGPMRLK